MGCIAVEVAAKPDLLLFLDEPTSGRPGSTVASPSLLHHYSRLLSVQGLDSAGAASIIRLLRKLAQRGQAILVTVSTRFPNMMSLEHFGIDD